MSKICTKCQSNFEITPEDKLFYEKVSPSFLEQKFNFSEPSLCPTCRAIRRMSWRNERKLYKRQCNLCQKDIVAMYQANTKFPVYCSDCWWSDKWDPYIHGKDFDFGRPFFEQFMELRDQTPHFDRAVLQSTMENSDYCNHAGYLKNCYLIFNTDESERCLYGKGMNRCFDCVDGFKIYDCNLCYEALNCTNCTRCTFIIDSHNTTESHFVANLVGCNNCFFSVNLRNKEYYIYNKPVPKEEYAQRVAEILKSKTQSQLWAEFKNFRDQNFTKWMEEKQTEACTGDYLAQSKNCLECYDCEYLEDSKYCSDLKKGEQVSHDNYDISYFGMGVDLSYECSVAGYGANHIAFCENVWQSYDILYSQLCVNGSHDLFGCFGIKKGEYSILNKRYSKEEYEKMCIKIIEHMKKTGEWGEFFPVQYSPFAYNESTSFEYFPLNKEEAISKKLKWFDEVEPDYSHVTKKIEASKAPSDINKINDDVLNWALICSQSGRLFQIQKVELDFYRKMNLPLPTLHPDLRHQNRNSLRNKRHLYQRSCTKCNKNIQSTHSPEKATPVYCQECYLSDMY